MARHLWPPRLVGRHEGVCPDSSSEGVAPMSLSPNGRRADAFARLLETGGRSDDPSVGPFLALAGALTAVPALDGPRPEFRAALRQRLVAVATVQGVAGPAISP